MSLANKTAVVTGGGSGIGRGIAEALAGAGCRVLIAGRREDVLADVARAWKPTPAMLTHVVDVADRASVSRLFRFAESQLERIDILVNCAGINTKRRTMSDLDPADWDRVQAINSTGVYNCIREVVPAMKDRRDGLIITISSVSGLRTSLLGGTAYCASKFAATALTTAVALEYGPFGIRVTNICPGEVDTPILDHRPQPVTAERRAVILQPEDIGAAVLMIAQLPPRAHIPELVIKPTVHDFA